MRTTQRFKYPKSVSAAMRPRPFLLALLALFMCFGALALASDPFPTAPSTPDPSTIPAGGGENAVPYLVTILAPAAAPAPNPVPSLLLRYHHDAPGPRTCIATIDDYDWAADDPRWDNTSLVKEAIVPTNGTHEETFTGVVPGAHILSVYCALPDGDDLQEAFRTVNATSTSTPPTGANASVTILSPGDTSGVEVNITIRHNATSQGSCALAMDATSLTTIIATVGENVTYRATASLGSHELRVSCAGVAWNASAAKSFRVRQGTPNQTGRYDPELHLQGSGPITADTPFEVIGSGFPPLDTIGLTLAGGGETATDETDSTAGGAISVPFDGLQDGSYRLTARSDSISGAVAVLLITVGGASATPLPTAPPPIAVPAPSNDEHDAAPIGGNPLPDRDTVQQDTTPTLYPTPDLEQPASIGSGSGWWLWLLPMAVIVLLLGGTAAYFVHDGMLDISSWDAFTRSASGLVRGDWRARRAAAAPPVRRAPTDGERRTIRAFVAKERRGGADDLAIRGALLAKGWEKGIVDEVFDELYREQRAGARPK